MNILLSEIFLSSRVHLPSAFPKVRSQSPKTLDIQRLEPVCRMLN